MAGFNAGLAGLECKGLFAVFAVFVEWAGGSMMEVRG